MEPGKGKCLQIRKAKASSGFHLVEAAAVQQYNFKEINDRMHSIGHSLGLGFG